MIKVRLCYCVRKTCHAWKNQIFPRNIHLKSLQVSSSVEKRAANLMNFSSTLAFLKLHKLFGTFGRQLPHPNCGHFHTVPFSRNQMVFKKALHFYAQRMSMYKSAKFFRLRDIMTVGYRLWGAIQNIGSMIMFKKNSNVKTLQRV